ncbi:uncharacterized protein LOC110675606 [Aedes aegypti]|uniref:Uncharacterized protein n=1 Tax=Aedes aegypti TaxID=7159 RepID=A0A6I8U5T2_AEDAE|nr:uncharacterized protein LOC110675606 [Aedes aegypti]
MWRSLVLLLALSIADLSARRVPENTLRAPPNMHYWKNRRDYSSIPLRRYVDHNNGDECKCINQLRLLRNPKVRAVIRRSDITAAESEEMIENYIEDYLLRLYLNRDFVRPPPFKKSAKAKSRTEKQVQRLPAFQHEKAEYSDEENFRMSHNSRFYSQEPVPGQLLYPPVSPKFQPMAKSYVNPYVSGMTKPRYVSSMLIPHFLNQTIAKPNETVRNILRLNSSETENHSVAPKRIRYGKNSGYINMQSYNKSETVSV